MSWGKKFWADKHLSSLPDNGLIATSGTVSSQKHWTDVGFDEIRWIIDEFDSALKRHTASDEEC